VATSYAPAWHLDDAVTAVALELTPQSPRATYLATVTGNRATFPGGNLAINMMLAFRLDGRVAAVAPAAGAFEVSVTVQEGDAPPATSMVRSSSGAEIPIAFSRGFDATTACKMDRCDRVLTVTFTLVSGSGASGTFDAGVTLDGPDVPKGEAPDGPILELNVTRAP
jgi:hypothetical protein